MVSRSCVWAVFVGPIYEFVSAFGMNFSGQETGQAPSLQGVMVRGRLAPFPGSCALAARRRGARRGGGALPRRDGAEPRHHTSWGLGGTRFRDGRTKRQLFRLNLPPSWLLGTGARPKLKQIIESPDGRAGPDRGMSPLISTHFRGGWAPVNRDGRKVTSISSPVPGFFVCCPFFRSLQKCSGMLNVLPYMVPVKR